MQKNAYSVKNVSIDAVVSCVLAGISILCMAGAVWASYSYDGNGPAIVGLLGMGSFLMAGVGIGFGVAAWKSQDGGLRMKRIAIILNMLPLLATLILYVVGWVVA